MITDDQRMEAAKLLNNALDETYSSPESGYLMRRIFDAHIDNDNYLTYATIIGDTILGFHHTKDLPQLLQKEVGLSADQAQRVVADLAEFLTPVLEREAAQTDAKKKELQNLSTTIGTNSQKNVLTNTPVGEQDLDNAYQTSDSVPSGEATLEPELFEGVQAMRTMKGDMKRIHGYGAYRDAHPDDNPQDDEPVVRSSQSELLAEKPKLAETPKIEG